MCRKLHDVERQLLEAFTMEKAYRIYLHKVHPASLENTPNSLFDQWLTDERYNHMYNKQQEFLYSGPRQEQLEDSLEAASHSFIQEDEEEQSSQQQMSESAEY